MSDKVSMEEAGIAGGIGAEAALDERVRTEIADILSDQSLSLDEKRARLEDVRAGYGSAETSEDETYAPLEHQLMHALSLLADGGHDYRERPEAAKPLGEAQDLERKPV